MKRILVFSDTHGDISLCKREINRVPADMIIHAGDYDRDVRELRAAFPDKDIRCVLGNNDLLSRTPRRVVAELDGVRIYVVHGHEQHVKYDQNYETLVSQAKENNCSVAVFGHTHMPYDEIVDGVHLINPGSARFGGTYAVIEIENGRASSSIIDSVY